jgi:EAL domain-containing protein (putative c-di-GMP-specific phosphodiesterase class I)
VLTLEVTERDRLPVGAGAVVEALAGVAGVRVVLDDFGSGVRTLADLRDHLPGLSGIKLDAGFVAGLGVDRTATAVVVHLLGLARSLGLTVTAEGVESALQLRLLTELGCDRGQGWLWCPALPAAEFGRLLE